LLFIPVGTIEQLSLDEDAVKLAISMVVRQTICHAICIANENPDSDAISAKMPDKKQTASPDGFQAIFPVGIQIANLVHVRIGVFRIAFCNEFSKLGTVIFISQ
jgi:hypothetical protein